MLKQAYRRSFYPLFKVIERKTRTLIFALLHVTIPKFNAFRIFGIPRSITTMEGEEIIPQGLEKRSPPQAIDSHCLPHFAPLEITSPGGSFVIVQNGFSTSAAATLNEQGKLIANYTEQFGLKDMHRHKLFTFRMHKCLPSISHFDAKVASLTVDGQWNYYHWLFDVLPKIYLLKQKGISPDFYYADYQKPFQKESLTLLGITEEKVLPAHMHPTIQATSLVVTSFPCMEGIARWGVTFIRNSFLPHAKPTNVAKKIFISRKNAAYRQFINEEELIPFLLEQGFTIVQCETLAFTEQIALFQSADFILAPHGAGLANLVFCRPGTKVIELFPPRFVCHCYWALSHLVDIDYTAAIGIDDKTTYSPVCAGYDHLVMDIPKLKDLLYNLLQI